MEMAIFNLPPELLTFNNWASVQGQFPSVFKNKYQIVIQPLNFGAIYNPVIGLI
jgi:hypothetical protein